MSSNRKSQGSRLLDVPRSDPRQVGAKSARISIVSTGIYHATTRSRFDGRLFVGVISATKLAFPVFGEPLFARFGVSARLSFRAQQTRGSLITHSSRSFIRLDEHGFPVHGGNSRTVISPGRPPWEHAGATPNRRHARFYDNNIEGGTRRSCRLGCSSSAISDDPLLP